MEKFLVLCLLTVASYGQMKDQERTPNPITTSGNSVTFYDRAGSGTLTFAFVITGSPSAMSIVVNGCADDGTTCAVLTSAAGTAAYTATASGFSQFTGGYANYKITATWTGTAAVQVYKTGIQAKMVAPGSGGTNAPLTNDVSAPAGGGPATVNSVGGKNASSVASSVNTVAAATPASTPNALVQRDSTGGVAVGPISSTSVNPNVAIPFTTNYPGAQNIASFTTAKTGTAFAAYTGVYNALTNSAPCHDLGSNDTSATGWCITTGAVYSLTNYARGISSIFSMNHYHGGIGDVPGIGLYEEVFGGQTQSADEGVPAIENQTIQTPYTKAVLTGSPTTGSTLITGTLSQGKAFNDGGFLLDVNTSGISVTLASNATFDSTARAQYYTTTGTALPLSTAIGTVNSCSVSGNGQAQSPTGTAYSTNTCSMSFTSGTPVVTTNAATLVCMSGVEEEPVFITSVTGSGPYTVSFNSRYAWNSPTNGASIMQGGVCGQYFVDNSVASTWPVAYMAQGASSTTKLYFANAVRGSANGTISGSTLPAGRVVTFYKGTEVIGTNGGTTNQANLAANFVPFAAGDNVIVAPVAEFAYVGMRTKVTKNSPSPCNYGGDLNGQCANAYAWEVDDAGLYPLDAVVSYYGTGLASRPLPAFVSMNGAAVKNWYRSNVTPVDALFAIESNAVSGGSPDLRFLQFHHYAGYGQLDILAATGQMKYNFGFQPASLSVGNISAGTSPICANGTGGTFTTTGCTGGGGGSAITGLRYGNGSSADTVATPAQVQAAGNDPSVNSRILYNYATGGDTGAPTPSSSNVIDDVVSGGILNRSYGGATRVPVIDTIVGAGVSISGHTATISATGNTTSTSLTSGTIPKASGANAIVNSLLTDNGTTLSYSGTGGIASTGTSPMVMSNTASNSDMNGLLTMSSGTISRTFTGTYTSAPVCVASDTSSIAAVRVVTTTTTLTITGTGSDGVAYLCMGRN